MDIMFSYTLIFKITSRFYNTFIYICLYYSASKISLRFSLILLFFFKKPFPHTFVSCTVIEIIRKNRGLRRVKVFVKMLSQNFLYKV